MNSFHVVNYEIAKKERVIKHFQEAYKTRRSCKQAKMRSDHLAKKFFKIRNKIYHNANCTSIYYHVPGTDSKTYVGIIRRQGTRRFVIEYNGKQYTSIYNFIIATGEAPASACLATSVNFLSVY